MGYWDHLPPNWDLGIGIVPYRPMGYWDHLPPNWDCGIGITYLPTGVTYRPMGYWDHLPPNWDWGIGITYPNPSWEVGDPNTPWGGM